MRRRDVLAHAHIARAQFAGHDGLAFGGEQVVRREAREQLAVQVLNRVDAVKPRGAGVTDIALFDRGFGLHEGGRQPLTGSEVLVLGKVLPQHLLDLVRPRVLAFDAVRVLRVHAAQQRAQFGRNRLAGQSGCSTRQVVCLGEQQLLLLGSGQQRFELMGSVVHGKHICQECEARIPLI